MLCPKTFHDCRTPSMCAPYGGCNHAPSDKIVDLEKRVAQLERLMRHICPDKSDDI